MPEVVRVGERQWAVILVVLPLAAAALYFLYELAGLGS